MNILYGRITKFVELTEDEVELIKELLLPRLDQCVSIGEEITVRDLLEKLE